jgi:hypothetical protein
MSAETVTLWNNRLGITTLAPPKELHPAARAALVVRLKLAPGASVELPREVWELMARRPGNQAIVLTGEIATKRSDTLRRTPPSSLDKIDRRTLGAPRGPSDFVHGLAADPALLRDVERARRSTPGASTRAAVAKSALASTQPGDYDGLVQALAAEGVSLDSLRAHLDHGKQSGSDAERKHADELRAMQARVEDLSAKLEEQRAAARPAHAQPKPSDESIPGPSEAPPALQPTGALVPETPTQPDRPSGRKAK